MAVTHDDVRHVAELARLAVPESKLEDLATELNGILRHMDILSQVDTNAVDKPIPLPGTSTPLRSDGSGPLLLQSPKELFAPSMRDSFFIVPRLATHDDAVESAP